ncbi:MAG TPA: hypothetical protein VMV18_08485 [bacterium]|nr:hypothetical protein [bacterium]
MENGTYKAKASTWALAESSKGTPEVAVEFVLTHPDMQGRSITWHGYLSEKTFNRTVESLRYCGWKGDDLSDLSGLDANEVSLVVENEEYEGETHPRVKWVNRAGGLAVKAPMSGDKAKAFAASMRERVRAFDAAKGNKPAPSNGGRPSYQEDTPPPNDDIPF